MNYEQLYAYLNTRPLPEIRACMLNVANLVRKYSGTADVGSDEEGNKANQTHTMQRRNRISQRIWTHQAVWNKFGSRSKDITSPVEASEAVSDLMVLPKVVEYMMSINSSIDEEVGRNAQQEKWRPCISTPFSTGTNCSHAYGQNESTAHTPKRARTSSSVTPKQWHDNHTVGSSDVSVEEETEWSLDGKNNIVDDTPGTSTTSTGPTVTSHGTKRPHESTKTKARTAWTEDMDNALIAAQEQHSAEGWRVIAQAVGYSVTKHQCVDRWNRLLAPKLAGQKTGTLHWADAEVNLLQELVKKHTLPAAWNHRLNCLGEERTDWTAIAAVLGRTASFCCAKWRSVRTSTMKKGLFTLAEDAYIERRVAEWGDTGMGLWAALEKEMNRNNHSIISRWKSLTSRKT